MIWAFIPARGGSKSIPLKNIKDLCGKPLIFWVINALQNTEEVDRIVLATDSPEIERVANCFECNKLSIYRRLPENAQDSSSTESVMLEFLAAREEEVKNQDIFMLVQATSPLTQPKHFSEGIAKFTCGGYDSLLSCARVKKFFWNDDGRPINYDCFNRPRRQEFAGILQENGAFYINSVGNIRKNKNRLYGNVGIYEMPEFSALDIDEPSDWILAENFMKRHVLSDLK